MSPATAAPCPYSIKTIQTTTAAAVSAALRAFADVGADEVLLVPMMPALDQVDRVVELLPID